MANILISSLKSKKNNITKYQTYTQKKVKPIKPHHLCIDSDSGLGRATPPRRAPSPGMGPGARHLPSPSGPGSLPPGLMTKRRIFDDGSSDISSAASSMMDYSGLYFNVLLLFLLDFEKNAENPQKILRALRPKLTCTFL